MRCTLPIFARGPIMPVRHQRRAWLLRGVTETHEFDAGHSLTALLIDFFQAVEEHLFDVQQLRVSHYLLLFLLVDHHQFWILHLKPIL